MKTHTLHLDFNNIFGGRKFNDLVKEKTQKERVIFIPYLNTSISQVKSNTNVNPIYK